MLPLGSANQRSYSEPDTREGTEKRAIDFFRRLAPRFEEAAESECYLELFGTQQAKGYFTGSEIVADRLNIKPGDPDAAAMEGLEGSLEV